MRGVRERRLRRLPPSSALTTLLNAWTQALVQPGRPRGADAVVRLAAPESLGLVAAMRAQG